MKRPLLLSFLSLATCCFSVGSTSAQQPPADVILGDWRISQALPGVCQVITRSSDRLAINVWIMKADRRAVLILQTDLWRLSEGEQLEGESSYDNWQTAQGATFTANPLAESLRLTPDDMMIGAQIGTWPAASAEGPVKLSARIPEIYFTGEFVIGETPELASTIESCLLQ